MKLSSLVNVTITRLTTFLSQAGFGSALVFGSSARMGTDKVRSYSDLDAVAADFQTSDPEYKWAQAYFGQNPRPTVLYIGARSAKVAQQATITVNTATEGHAYKATLNGVEYSYTAVSGDDAAEIAAALAALMDADTTVQFTTGGLAVIAMTAVEAGTPFTIACSDSLMTLTNTTANNGITEDLNAIVQVVNGNNWFGLALVGETDADQMLAADWIEAHDKIFIVRITDTDAITSGGATVPNYLFSEQYAQTAWFFTDHATEYPDAAWYGRQLPQAPGSSVWGNKTLTGITASTTLTDTQIGYIRAKNGNFYGSINSTIFITLDGKMASGEWIDVMVGCAWLKNKMATDVFNAIYQAEKVDYDDKGIGIVSNVVRAALQAATSNKILSASSNSPYNGASYIVSVPKADDIAAATRATRRLSSMTFRGHLAGAIQTAEITGTVEY